MTLAASPDPDSPRAVNGGAKRSWYFIACAATLLAAVVAGFSPTFFLRFWLQEDHLPVYLHLHGVVLTAWFALFFAQTILVIGHRPRLHRRLGVLGAVLAPIVVITSLMAIFGMVANAGNNGFDVVRDRGQMEFIIWSDLGAILAFTTFVALGLSLRRRAGAHKRLLLLGSLSIMSPALIRLSSLPPFNALGGVIFVLIAFVLMTLSLVVFDLVTRRRIHLATLTGVPFFFVAILGSAFFVPGSQVGRLIDPLFASAGG